MMIFRLLRFFFGYLKIAIPENYSADVLNFLISSQCYFSHPKHFKNKKDASSELYFNITKKDFSALVQFAEQNSIPVRICAKCGIPFLWEKYCRRTGLMIGLLAFIMLLTLSNFFVWDIRITGNETLQKEVILQRLSDMGLSVGTRIHSIDYSLLCNDFVMNYDDVIWISVNVQGTVCCVEVRERNTALDNGQNLPSNLVSDFAGQIESLEVYDGLTMVFYGDTVRKGDLLVSGVVETRNGAILFRRARGHVYAKTTHRFSVDVPFVYTTKEYSGAEKKQHKFEFFGKSAKLYRREGWNVENFDTIEVRNQLSIGDLAELPCYLITVTHREYELVSHTRSEQEALDEAYRLLYQKIDSELSDFEILERVVNEEIRDDGVTLYCDIYCIMDIAKEVPIVKTSD